MAAEHVRAVVPAAVGSGFGFILGSLAFAETGAGHGCFVLLGLASSPFGLAQSALVAWVMTYVIWNGMGALLGLGPRAPLCYVGFVLVMVAHYAALPAIMSDPEHFGDWSYVDRLGRWHQVGVALYVAGHVCLWGLFIYGVGRLPSDVRDRRAKATRSRARGRNAQ